MDSQERHEMWLVYGSLLALIVSMAVGIAVSVYYGTH